MELIFLGYPGSGKGTQAGLLSERYNIPKISTGDILRAAVMAKTDLGLEAKQYMDRGELVPDSVIIGLVVQRIAEPDSVRGFILDGFPRTIHQAQELDRMFLDLTRRLLAVISLEIEKKKVIARLTSRRVCAICGKLFNLETEQPPADNKCDNCGGDVYQRSDDKPETVLHRMDVYEQQTQPLKDYYGLQGKLLQVDGNLNVEKVQAEILKRLRMLVEPRS
ncbi:MAG: adenylate kinase [candidate division KSB1 bacterium]